VPSLCRSPACRGHEILAHHLRLQPVLGPLALSLLPRRTLRAVPYNNTNNTNMFSYRSCPSSNSRRLFPTLAFILISCALRAHVTLRHPQTRVNDAARPFHCC
jgi:hypothetical protein